MGENTNLLILAAGMWKSLSRYQYILTYGYKGALYDIKISFPLDSFPHLAGFQYLNDIKFPRFNYARAVKLILSGTIKYETIIKSSEYEKSIKPRLEALVGLKATLENEFSLYSYMPQFYSFTTKIKADYLISSCNTPPDYIFIIKSNRNGNLSMCDYVCCSSFSQTQRDYRENQRLRKILKLVRVDLETMESTVLLNRIDDAK